MPGYEEITRELRAMPGDGLVHEIQQLRRVRHLRALVIEAAIVLSVGATTVVYIAFLFWILAQFS